MIMLLFSPIFPGTGGECDSLNQVDTELCLKCIRENPQHIVGVKVRLAELVTNNGKLEEEVYRFDNPVLQYGKDRAHLLGLLV